MLSINGPYVYFLARIIWTSMKKIHWQSKVLIITVVTWFHPVALLKATKPSYVSNQTNIIQAIGASNWNINHSVSSTKQLLHMWQGGHCNPCEMQDHRDVLFWNTTPMWTQNGLKKIFIIAFFCCNFKIFTL